MCVIVFAATTGGMVLDIVTTAKRLVAFSTPESTGAEKLLLG